MDRSSSSSSSSTHRIVGTRHDECCWLMESAAAPLPRTIFGPSSSNSSCSVPPSKTTTTTTTKQQLQPTPVALVQAHDCYCVCLRHNSHDNEYSTCSSASASSSSSSFLYQLAVWRKDDPEAVIYLQATFTGVPPLLQIAKAAQEHSCWFVYAIDNRRHDQRQPPSSSVSSPPRLLAWEITARSFLVPTGASTSSSTSTSAGVGPAAATTGPPSIPPHRAMDVWPTALWPHHRPRADADITSLSVYQPDYTPKPMLLLGTAGGTVLWSTQISVPMDFQIQKMEPSSLPRKSMLARYTPTLDGIGALVKYQPPDTSIVAVIPLSASSPPLTTTTTTAATTTTTFVVVHSSGKLVFWTMKPPHYHFQRSAADEWVVLDKLRQYFADQHNTGTNDDHLLLYDMQVQAALASSTTLASSASLSASSLSSNTNKNNNSAAVIVLLCNVQHSDDDYDDDDSDRAAAGQQSSSLRRQYWVVVQGRELRAVLPLRSTDRVTDCVMGTDGTPYLLVEEDASSPSFVSSSSSSLLTTTTTTIHGSDYAPQQTLITLCLTQSSSSSSSSSSSTATTLSSSSVATPSISMAPQTLPTTTQRGTLCPDHTTHGVLLLSRHSPSLLRARFLAPAVDNNTNSSSSSSDYSNCSKVVLPTALSSSSSSREMEVLRSLFEAWYTASAADGPAAVSVSLQNPYLHAAVLPLAHTVSQSSSFRNPMERHLSYIQFLQTIGLYKYLPEATKWSLLAIGQAIEVVKQVAATTRLGKQHQPPPAITADNIGEFLLSAQRENGGDGSSSSNGNTVGLWLECLHAALLAARQHRQTYAPPRTNALSYDIVDPTRRAPPGIVWTASILPSVLERQLSMWDAQQPNGIPDIADPALYLDILQWILEAYRDYGVPHAYGHTAQRVFAVVRRTFGKKRDPWLFGLCRDHGYYHGVLTIHADYTPCAAFSLITIAATAAAATAGTVQTGTTTTTTITTLEPDIETGLPFKHYALKWLAEHGTAIGRAIKLHDEWPDEFYEVAETTPALKPFQWMVDLLRENHNKVAEELLGQILAAVNLPLSRAGVVVGAAYASNELVILDDPANRERAKERAKLLEKKQDLLIAQYRFHSPPKMFLTTANAVNKAMKPIIDKSPDIEIKDFSLALELCNTFEIESDSSDGVRMVWFHAILADKAQWLELIDQEPDLTAAHVLDKIDRSTFFGQLFEHGGESDDENSPLSWSSASWDKLGELDDLFSHLQFRRLITAFSGSRIGRDKGMILA